MDQETNQRSVLNTLMSPAASMTADATIAIIAEEGFDRVSVRSVAARLASPRAPFSTARRAGELC